MWINAQGGLYTGDMAQGDRAATQNEIDARQNARIAALAQQSIEQADLDKWDRKLKALALVTKPSGMTFAQFKAALKSAYDSLA